MSQTQKRRAVDSVINGILILVVLLSTPAPAVYWVVPALVAGMYWNFYDGFTRRNLR